jgi:hypothetical protein
MQPTHGILPSLSDRLKIHRWILRELAQPGLALLVVLPATSEAKSDAFLGKSPIKTEPPFELFLRVEALLMYYLEG